MVNCALGYVSTSTQNIGSDFDIDKPLIQDIKIKNFRVDHPSYYNGIPGIECIDVVKHHDFCTGNAIKYLWRAGLKSEEGISNKQKEIEDLEKAIWYINAKINELKNGTR